MKHTFRKITLAALVLCLGSTATFAQLKRFSIGPYLEVATPAGDFHDTHGTGYGGGINADIKLIAGLGVTGSVGFERFGGKTVTQSYTDPVSGNITTNSYKNPSINAIPIRVGLKYHFFPLLYVKAEGGVVNFVDSKYSSGAAAIFAPGIGIRVLMLDVEAKYEIWSHDGSNGFWGLKAGFNF